MLGLIDRAIQLLPQNSRKRLLVASLVLLVTPFLEGLGLILVYDFISQRDGSYLKTILLNCELSSSIRNQALLVFTFFLVKTALSFGTLSVRYSFLNQIRDQFCEGVLRNLLSKPYLFFTKTPPHELIRLMTDEISNFVDGVLASILVFVAEAATIFVLIAVLTYCNPSGMLILPLIVISTFVAYRFVSEKMTKRFGQVYQSAGFSLMKVLNSAFSNMKEVKCFRQEDSILQMYRNSLARYTWAFTRFRIFGDFFGQVIELLTVVAILGLAISIQGDSGEVGSLAASLALFGAVALRILPSLTRLFGAINLCSYARPSLDLLSSYDIASRVGSQVATLASPLRFESLEVRGVTFAYDGEVPVFEAISFSIQRGTSFAIAGASGSGKSTLIDLIVGLLTPKEGKILVNSKDIQGLSEAWQACIGYVSQNSALFDGTVRENLLYGNKAVTDEKIWEVLQRVKLDELVRNHREGLETIVGERGVCFSGGQRQRLLLARVLLRNPSVLILDEATSALDPALEEEILDDLFESKGPMTIILVSHKTQVANRCTHKLELKANHVRKTTSALLAKL